MPSADENGLRQQVQVAADMIQELQIQRNAALDDYVKVATALRAARRVIEVLVNARRPDSEVEELLVGNKR